MTTTYRVATSDATKGFETTVRDPMINLWATRRCEWANDTIRLYDDATTIQR